MLLLVLIFVHKMAIVQRQVYVMVEFVLNKLLRLEIIGIGIVILFIIGISIVVYFAITDYNRNRAYELAHPGAAEFRSYLNYGRNNYHH